MDQLARKGIRIMDGYEALRIIAYGSPDMLREYLAKIDPEGYYPNARQGDLIIHIARTVLGATGHSKCLNLCEIKSAND